MEYYEVTLLVGREDDEDHPRKWEWDVNGMRASFLSAKHVEVDETKPAPWCDRNETSTGLHPLCVEGGPHTCWYGDDDPRWDAIPDVGS